MLIRALIFSLLMVVVSCKGEPDERATQNDGEQEPPGIAAITKRIGDQPNNAELYYSRADLYFNNGEIGKGIRDLQQAISRDSSVAYFYMRLADEYLQNEDKTLELPDSRKAIEILQHFLRQYPKNQKVRLKLAEVYLYVEQYEQALSTLDAAIQHKAYNPEAYFQKGVTYKYAGDTSRAMQSFQMAVEQDPQRYDAYMQLGLLASEGNPELAATYFDNALSVKPNSTEAQYAKAKLLQDAGAFDQAKAIYRQMVLKNSQDENIFFNLGYIYYEQDSFDKAERQFDIAIQLNPTYAQAYYARGIVRETLGKNNEALRDYQNALRVDPDHRYAEEALNELKEKL